MILTIDFIKSQLQLKILKMLSFAMQQRIAYINHKKERGNNKSQLFNNQMFGKFDILIKPIRKKRLPTNFSKPDALLNGI